uniref:DUF6598 domain-containing protein n=1 Tax=Setaria italica TaxID=4555 RepID=K3YBT3_SETIT
MKETDGHPDDKEREEARNGDLKREGEVGSEESKMEPVERERKPLYEKYLEWKRRKEEEEEEEERKRNPEKVTDPYAFEARLFRQRWDEFYLKNYGCFDKKEIRTRSMDKNNLNAIHAHISCCSNIPCKRFTHNTLPHGGTADQTLQVFYVKVGGITGGLQWPLEVFGLVALRDSVDYNHNIIFERERDKCQILTDQNPYLELTGPVRAVMIYGRVIFEASLYVKGATRSDDKELSLLATSLGQFPSGHSCLIERSYSSRLSTLELMLGHLTCSVEATIEVRVTSGPWPDGFRCIFRANASIGQWILLLETADDPVPLTGDKISFARQVVSVDSDRELKVAATITNGSAIYTDEKGFKPLKMGASTKELRIGGCMLEVTVYWSCFPFAPV